jgi:class 3 adenylate cyclase
VVSIIFADLVGSTALHERLDAEAVRQFMERYYAAMRGAVEAHGGRVTQVMGDGVKAVFGAPRVAEDDAIRAVRAAVAMQEAFHALAVQQSGRVGKTGLRVAVNTGEVVSDGESEIIGDPVNVAARLQEQGKDGDVVIGGATQRIVAALVTLELLGRFTLKGRAEQVEAYRVVSLEPPAATRAAFVGRDAELARLAAVYETVVAKPAAQLAVLLGSPGLGKSRLIEEFVRRLGDAALVFTAHCNASGGASFAPLAAALRERLGVADRAKPEVLRAALVAALPAEDSDRARVVAGVTSLASGAPSSPEETFFVIRRLLAAFAQAKPVVLVIDDLHWAESLLLDLVEHLVQWGSGVPLFVLVGARPELRELRSSLVMPGGFVADVLTLSGVGGEGRDAARVGDEAGHGVAIPRRDGADRRTRNSARHGRQFRSPGRDRVVPRSDRGSGSEVPTRVGRSSSESPGSGTSGRSGPICSRSTRWTPRWRASRSSAPRPARTLRDDRDRPGVRDARIAGHETRSAFEGRRHDELIRRVAKPVEPDRDRDRGERERHDFEPREIRGPIEPGVRVDREAQPAAARQQRHFPARDDRDEDRRARGAARPVDRRALAPGQPFWPRDPPDPRVGVEQQRRQRRADRHRTPVSKSESSRPRTSVPRSASRASSAPSSSTGTNRAMRLPRFVMTTSRRPLATSSTIRRQ